METTEDKNQFADLLRELEQILDKIPGTSKARAEVETLRRLLVERRPARLALVGRRGSGKSSLINAIFGEEVADVGHVTSMTGRGRWWSYDGDLGTLEILDTRGLQEGSAPDAGDSAGSPLESILEALKKQEPDAILFLVKANDVDAAIDGDIEQLNELQARLSSPAPVVCVLTHCDQLEPQDVLLHAKDNDPRDVEEKRANIAKASRHIEQKLRSSTNASLAVPTIIGVSSYLSWREDGSVRSDRRWNIEHLIEYLLTELPDEAQVKFARLTKVRRLQRRIANRIVSACSVAAGGIAATPIPIGDLLPLTSLQIAMSMSIAYLSGRKLDFQTVKEFIGALGANIGIGFGIREAARALMKVIAPGAGMVVSAGIAAGVTNAIGRAAIAYYVDGASKEEARRVFKNAYRLGSSRLGSSESESTRA